MHGRGRRLGIALRLGALAAVLVLGSLSLWLYGQGWSILHRRGVPFLGKVVPVARGWFLWTDLKSDPPDILFFLPPEVVLLSGRSRAVMTFGHNPVPHETSEQAVRGMAKALNMAELAGERDSGPYRVDSTDGESWCYTSSYLSGRFEDIECSLFDAAWTAEYTGPRSHAKDFFRVIAGIQDVKK